MKKNKKMKWNIRKVVGATTLLFNLVLTVLLLVLNVLPMKYLIPIVIIFIGIDALIILFGFIKKLKKKGNIIYIVLNVLWCLICIFGSFYLFKTISFMGGLGSSNEKTENYSVIVLKDSSYEKVEDIKNKEVGIVSYQSEGKDKAKEHLSSKVSVNYKDFETPQDLENALLDKDIDVIMVEDSYVEMFKEINEDFESLTKVIYTFSVQMKAEDISKDVSVTKEPFSIYISGIDTYGKISSVSRSDVNMVATVNPNTNQVLLISIPRDYYVKLHGTTGYNDKLTHAGIYGVDMSVKTIEDLLGININYYVKVNFSSVIKIVDVLGGVDVYSEYTFKSYSGYNFTKGYNHMNGEQALDFARTRKAFASGDRQRGKNQQAVIEALIRKCSSASVITKYSSLLDSLSGSFQTNMSTKEITSLAKYQLDKMPEWTVKSISLDGGDSYNYTYSYGRSKSYVMTPYESSIKEAQQALSEILGGAVQESSYSKVSNVKTPSTNTNSNSNSSTNNSRDNQVSTEPTIKLSSDDITIEVGEITTLTATVTNSKESVSWSSSDTSVASVSNGKITPIRAGTVTITAKVGNKSATCIVRINKKQEEKNPLQPILPSEEEKITGENGSSSNNEKNTESETTNSSNEKNNEDTQN
jgi:LCP family protein required for cell wall assembly